MNSVFQGERLVQCAMGIKRNTTNSPSSGRRIEEGGAVLGKASQRWRYLYWVWKDEQEFSKWERRERASPVGGMTCSQEHACFRGV